MEKISKKKVSNLKKLALDFFEDNINIEAIEFDGIVFDEHRMTHTHLRNCTFKNCVFNGCIFDEVDFQRVYFTDCKFHFCTLNKKLRFITGSVESCEVVDCDFSNAFIQNTKWIKNDFKNVEFNNIKAKSIDYCNCSFDNVSFDGANLVRGSFNNIEGLERNIFYNTKLDDCIFDWLEAFIVMEFDNAITENLYTYAVEPVLQEFSIESKRVDRYEFHGRITDEILQNLVTCQFVIAECSASNKNVFFEIGYALGNRKPIIFCVDDVKNIPFDLKDYKFIIHNNKIDNLKRDLKSRVKFILEHYKLSCDV